MDKTYINLKKLGEKHGEVEFQAEVSVEVLETFISRELERAARDFELPGFRKGKVPVHIVREHLDEARLLESAANDALHDAVHEIITDENLSIVGSPRVTITKIAPKNPLGFKVMFALYPEVKLPDYKKIGAEIAARADAGAGEVSEKEVDDAIERLLSMMAPMENKEGAGTDAMSADATTKPKLTDEMVAKLGPFKTVDEFKTKLKENLTQDKTMEAKEAKREEIMKMIVQQSKVELPEMLLDEEWYAFEERRNAQLEESNLKLEDYLKQSGKTEKELEADERKLITERIKTSLVFREIQKVEAIEPSEKEIQTNIAYLKLRYKDRSEAWLRETAEALIIQEKIFALLGLPMGTTE